MAVNVPQYLYEWLHVRDAAVQQTGLAMTAQAHMKLYVYLLVTNR
jgi:hypothetical protein